MAKKSIRINDVRTVNLSFASIKSSQIIYSRYRELILRSLFLLQIQTDVKNIDRIVSHSSIFIQDINVLIYDVYSIIVQYYIYKIMKYLFYKEHILISHRLILLFFCFLIIQQVMYDTISLQYDAIKNLIYQQVQIVFTSEDFLNLFIDFNLREVVKGNSNGYTGIKNK